MTQEGEQMIIIGSRTGGCSPPHPPIHLYQRPCLDCVRLERESLVCTVCQSLVSLGSPCEVRQMLTHVGVGAYRFFNYHLTRNSNNNEKGLGWNVPRKFQHEFIALVVGSISLNYIHFTISPFFMRWAFRRTSWCYLQVPVNRSGPKRAWVWRAGGRPPTDRWLRNVIMPWHFDSRSVSPCFF